MATQEGTIEVSPQPAPAPEPPSEDAVAAVVHEISKEIKEGKKGGEGDLKATILISGVVVAVVGAIFAIFKKVKGSA
ncbi:hypothetical protein H5410_058161 [Solanum commersonii]|uniref:Uncharacterized protein n=1 Tax=Solanum commersonii TaxID=4109 RepID=A0A9J5WPX8_SOLCO|nr:hypothetical protein H5410_058161 [Solanum commersonii]